MMMIAASNLNNNFSARSLTADGKSFRRLFEILIQFNVSRAGERCENHLNLVGRDSDRNRARKAV